MKTETLNLIQATASVASLIGLFVAIYVAWLSNILRKEELYSRVLEKATRNAIEAKKILISTSDLRSELKKKKINDPVKKAAFNKAKEWLKQLHEVEVIGMREDAESAQNFIIEGRKNLKVADLHQISARLDKTYSRMALNSDNIVKKVTSLTDEIINSE
ncbi:hypothetical protein [Halomonas dongshanensis]|uniref:Uncharacterized protein n=1 Tax=Halomonas dongshanensis TaxID=2890835 RepID=A0ABT2EFQ3_9GAMM|nr:hypothetical protein [Halomonas dongshanensis]MCS2610424.1 hypothetical protein [Halomonas dongshanensis]